jgi:dTDP-4-amino-4,6-dideoxygalactose transaminase
MTGARPAIEGGDPVRQSVLGYGGQATGDAEKEAVSEVLDSDYITRGPTVDAFERDVESYLAVDHAIAVTSGTAALHLAGQSVGFGEGDEVITTPFTFVATAYTALHSGAKPVFADIDRGTRNIDPEAVRDCVTDNTAGLVPVHFAGRPCDIEELREIADEEDLTIIWDACHAFGSRWQGDLLGGERDVATFSFHPVKNITTAEGGMVVTNDDDIAERVRSLRSFQMNYEVPGHEDEPWYQVAERPGYNYNVTDLQAALGRTQLDRIQSFKRRRTEIVDHYDTVFADVPGVETPSRPTDAEPMWHLYTVEITPEFGCSRKQFVNAMHEENIGVQVHYVPLYQHPLFESESAVDYPNTEAVYERIVSLPLFPGMDDEDVSNVITAVEKLSTHYR